MVWGTPKTHEHRDGRPIRVSVFRRAFDQAANEQAALPSVSAGQGRFSDEYPRRDSNPRYRLEMAAC